MLSRIIKHRIEKPWQMTLLVIAVLLVFGVLLNAWFSKHVYKEEHEQVTSKLSVYHTSLSAVVNRKVGLLSSLEAFILTHPDRENLDPDFSELAASLYNVSEGVDSFSLVPQGINRYVYPLRGTREILGYNLFHDPDPKIQTDVQRALQSRTVVISQPQVFQNGMASLVARKAVFQGENFWGFVSVSLDLPAIIYEAGLTKDTQELTLALRDSSGNVFWGAAEIAGQDPAVVDIPLPDGTWQILAVPRGGWGSTTRGIYSAFVIGLSAIEILIATLAYFLSFRSSNMRKLVAERTRDLENELQERKKTEDLLRRERDMVARIMQISPVGILVYNTDGSIGFANARGLSLLRVTLEEITRRMYNAPEWHFTTTDGDPIRDEDLLFSRVKQQMQSVFDVNYAIHHPEDGSYEYFKANGSPVLDEFGQFVGVVSSIKDVTADVNATRALKESQEHYKQLIELSPDAIFVFEEDRVDFINQAGLKLFGAGSAEQLVGKPVLERIHPSYRESAIERMRSITRQQTSVQQLEEIFLRLDGTPVDVEVSATPFIVNGKQGGLVLARDVTQRRRTEQALMRQMEESTRHTRELEALTTVSSSLRTAQTRTELADLLVQGLVDVTEARVGALALLMDRELVIQAATGLENRFTGRPILQSEIEIWDVIHTGEHKICVCPPGDAKDQGGSLIVQLCHNVSSWILAPLKSGESTIGVVFLAYVDDHVISESNTNVVIAVADMAGNALQRMSTTETLEKLVSDRTRELESIYQVTSAASEILDLNSALQQALDQILAEMGSSMGSIFLINSTDSQLELVANRGIPPDVSKKLRSHELDYELESWVVENKRPLILSDLSEDNRSWWKNYYRHTISYIGLPMRVHDQVLGVLSVSRIGRNQLNLEEMTLLSFIADHLGLVVENARLRQQAERSAVMEERSRLARELHDSVTQSLYSATLFADSGRRFLNQGDLDQVDVYLSRLGQINQQALKDMRLLVYELRSPELHYSGLAGALHQRLDAVEHRSGVHSELQIENMPSTLPEKMEEALYRVALEALNNALKHAGATRVWIRLHRNSENHIIMEIEDNGKGFIPEEAVHRGGMGLTTMRERVERLGGQFQIDSIPGSGSCITASIPFIEASK